jgi:hypothetical protein
LGGTSTLRPCHNTSPLKESGGLSRAGSSASSQALSRVRGEGEGGANSPGKEWLVRQCFQTDPHRRTNQLARFGLPNLSLGRLSAFICSLLRKKFT